MPINDELDPYFDDLDRGEWRAAIVACLEDARRRKVLSVALLLKFGFEGFALLDDFLSRHDALREAAGITSQEELRAPIVDCIDLDYLSSNDPSSPPTNGDREL